MKLLDVFRFNTDKNSARVARERLKVIVAHERANRHSPDYLPAMREDILNVIRKYVHIDAEDVSVQLASEQDVSVLELNVVLPEKK